MSSAPREFLSNSRFAWVLLLLLAAVGAPFVLGPLGALVAAFFVSLIFVLGVELDRPLPNRRADRLIAALYLLSASPILAFIGLLLFAGRETDAGGLALDAPGNAGATVVACLLPALAALLVAAPLAAWRRGGRWIRRTMRKLRFVGPVLMGLAVAGEAYLMALPRVPGDDDVRFPLAFLPFVVLGFPLLIGLFLVALGRILVPSRRRPVGFEVPSAPSGGAPTFQRAR